jgi:predicted Zn-dependent protease
MQRRLKENQDKLGPADRILVQYYDALFDGRTLEAYRKARELLALAPHDFTYMFVAANLAKNLNRPHEALECLGDVEKIDWKTFGHWMQGTWVLGVAAFAHHLLGEYEAELKVAEFGVHLYPDMLNVRQDKVRALAALGRVADVDRTITESLGVRSQTQAPGDVMLTAAEELRAHGHTEDARRIAARCAEWYGALTGEEAAHSNVPLNHIECLWLTERWPEAADLAQALVKRTPTDPYAMGYRGILAARAGDRATADAMDKALAENTEGRMAARVSWARACIAAQRGERDQAMSLLREALGHGFTDLGALHVYVFLEPLRGYPPFEELLKPKG